LILVAQLLIAQEDEEVRFKTYWKNGARIESSDGNFKIKFGGRVQFDWAKFYEDDSLVSSVGQSPNGYEFRRVRFFNSGTIYGNIKYKLQFDFGEGVAELKDAYIMIDDIPLAGFLQIGRFKEPMGFDELTSSKYITFMERATVSDLLPSRNSGLMIGNSFLDERLSFRLGTFKDSDDFGNAPDTDDNYSFTGRIWGLPLYNQDKNQVLHLGFAYSHRSQQNSEYDISIRPEAHLANKYLSTETFTDASTRKIIQTEAVFISKSLAVKSELLLSQIERADLTNDDFNPFGFYGSVAYFLTGESKQYSTDGEYDRVKPRRNFDGNGGWGALEVAMRYSSMDFEEEGQHGNEMQNWTFGLNW
ncbi:MAG: hypothetical protein GY786_12740, partial [Proteobacteria bacterium]|nr:hypothetical protein [Pseudomonadota bacterium]